MAVAVGVGLETRWWEWSQIDSLRQLTWLPVDYELRDAQGVDCRAVGNVVAPPLGWIHSGTGEPYIPRLPARVIRER